MLSKRYATIDTETQGGGHQSLTQKSDPIFILLQNATVSSVGILVQFSAPFKWFSAIFPPYGRWLVALFSIFQGFKSEQWHVSGRDCEIGGRV
jgi:hypothetical protein